MAKACIISWPFHRYDECVTALLAVLFPHLDLFFYSHLFPAPVFVHLPLCLHLSGPLSSLKHVPDTGIEDAETTSRVHPQRLTFPVSPHSPLLYLFRCLPVHVAAGIRKLSLTCCQCQWLSCPHWVWAPPTLKAQALTSPARRNVSFLRSLSWEVGVKGGTKVWCAQGNVRGTKRERNDPFS